MVSKADVEIEIVKKVMEKGYTEQTVLTVWLEIEKALGNEFALTGNGIKRIRRVNAPRGT